MKPILAISLLLCAHASAEDTLPKFMGREVTVTESPTDPDGLFPTGPASVCIEGPPQRQCYTAPKEFGRSPEVELVEVEKRKPALLFSAASVGGSGFDVHFALLRPGTGKVLDNLLILDGPVSNQSQHEFWTDSGISPAPIFVTADFVWGPDEAHYGTHRFIISAYVFRQSELSGDFGYWLQDRYMTARQYDPDVNDDVLFSEKLEVLSRLARIPRNR